LTPMIPRDRPAPADGEFEITPEMIEAGADIILGCDLEEYRAHQIAEMVFKAMVACKGHATAGSESTPRMLQK
jgi:hypothetical protein